MAPKDPFNFGMQTWLATDKPGELDANDLGDSINLGETSDLTDSGKTLDPLVESRTTTVINRAPRSASFAGKNVSAGGGAMGIVGESHGSRGSVGVAGASAFWGVAGVATDAGVDITSTTVPFPDKVGVFGIGDKVGVCGQSRQNEQPLVLHSQPVGLGVLGVGDTIGVQGNGNQGVQGNGDQIGVRGATNHPGSGTQGTSNSFGVQGTSNSGIGVLGTQSREGHSFLPAPPELLRTGIMGIGDVRGGVFQVVPFPPPAGEITHGSLMFANIQLTPVGLDQEESDQNHPQYQSTLRIPVLPPYGKAGDLLAVNILDGQKIVPPGVQLWLCTSSGSPEDIKSGSPAIKAIWARIQLEITNQILP
jgi:hypothetical protein